MQTQPITQRATHQATSSSCTDTSKLALSLVLIGSALSLAAFPLLHRLGRLRYLHVFSVITGSCTAGLGVCTLFAQVFAKSVSSNSGIQNLKTHSNSTLKTQKSLLISLPITAPDPAPSVQVFLQEPCDEQAKQMGYEEGYHRQQQRLLNALLLYNTLKMCYRENIDPYHQGQQLLSMPTLPPLPCPGRQAETCFWKSYYQGYAEGHLIALTDYLQAAFTDLTLSNLELSYIIQDLTAGQVCLLRQRVGTLETELNFHRFSSPQWREDPFLLQFNWKIHIDTSSWRPPYAEGIRSEGRQDS